MTVDTSGITDANSLVDAAFTYQWVRVDGSDETDIQDATDSTYTLVSDDVGKKMKVEVSFIDDDDYAEGPLASDPTGIVSGVVLVRFFASLASWSLRMLAIQRIAHRQTEFLSLTRSTFCTLPGKTGQTLLI